MIETAMELLKDYGWAVFFAFICLVLAGLLVQGLLRDKKELVDALEKERERGMQLAAIIERRNEKDKQLIEAMGKLEIAVKADQDIQRDFLAYLQMRDKLPRGKG